MKLRNLKSSDVRKRLEDVVSDSEFYDGLSREEACMKVVDMFMSIDKQEVKDYVHLMSSGR